MLEMMPGSVMDKTNNNLSNLACAHSTIEQKINPEKEKIMDDTEPKEIPKILLNVENETETSECSIPVLNVSKLTVPSFEAATSNFTQETSEFNATSVKNECNIVSIYKTYEHNVASQEISKCNHSSQQIIKCTDVSKETSNLHVISQVTPECNVISQETSDCNIASQETSKCNVISQETSENNVASQETSEHTVLSQETCKFNIAPQDTFSSNVGSQKTYEPNVASQEISGCTAGSQEVSDIKVETSEFNIISQETSECNVASQKTSECSIVSQDSSSSNIVSQATLNCNIAIQEIFECNIASQEKSECSIASQETSECTVASQKTSENSACPKEISECKVATQETPNCIVTSADESLCNLVPQDSSECNVCPQETSEYKIISQETSICNASFQDTSLCNVDSREISECSVASQKTSLCNVVQEMCENNIALKDKSLSNVPQETTVVSQDTSLCNVVSQDTSLCNVVSQEISECSDSSQKKSLCNVLSQETSEINVSFKDESLSNLVSQDTSQPSVVSQDTSVFNIVSKEILLSSGNAQETLEFKIPANTEQNCNRGNEYMENNSTNKSSLKIVKKQVKNIRERKLFSFLIKHNITLEELIPKLKHLKRLTKDKKRTNSVLSLKLNRYYFKSKKPKWSNRMATKKKQDIINMYLKRKLILKQQLKTRSESSNESSQEELNINTNENKSLEQIIPDFKSDDDIRNKIKEQLELLRQNRKQVIKPIENLPNVSNSSEKPVEITNAETNSSTNQFERNLKPVPANLNDVLLSTGDVGLSIVSVVGGYFSDEETNHENHPEKDEHFEELKQETSVQCLTQINKGISITDILLKRELSQDNNLLDTITPTKTNDITKIKGWRRKQFVSINSSEKINIEDNVAKTEHQEKVEEITPKKKDEDILAENSIENPLPSTSFGYSESEAKNLSKTSVKIDNILKQGENTDMKNNTKSAFVSDMLDTFLSNHAKLQISYEVPKLVAEEAISKPASEMPVSNNNYLSVVSNSNSYSKRNINNKVIKPKTLAEKRRMIEKDRQDQLLQDMETNESIYLKQLEHCEKRNKNEIAKDVRENLLEKGTPFSRHCWNMATKPDEDARQFIVVNGNKIRILGSAGGEDVILPNEIKRTPTCKKHVYYKPGPLSRKHKLMTRNKNSDNWECRVLKMPKIKLVVCPEQGKRLPLLAEQYLQLYRGEKGFISDELAKFAVSAVRCEDNVKRKFEFEVPYSNSQNKLLVRKKRLRETSPDKVKTKINEEIMSPIDKKEFSHINVEDSIKNIMSNMLNCIENQELDKIIIKEDPDLNNSEEKKVKYVYRPPSPIDPMVQAIIKRPNARRSKTSRELRRLNVQVIEVDVKEDENESEICTKDFCKLGCVCKSLRVATSLVPEHCGLESCMLECSCSFGNSQRGHHSITLPAGTDLLSASTVVRLQDEVNRKLAKEEREFAQTVIKANNQTIMVGGGTRERQRRIPKVPKKYSNYVQKNKTLPYGSMISVRLQQGDEDFEAQMGKIAVRKAKEAAKKQTEQRLLEVELKKPVPIWIKNETQSWKAQYNNKDCCVKLAKLKLDNIIPWCMVHNLYKCHCGGKATFEPAPTKPREEKTNSDEFGNKNEYIAYAPRFQTRHNPEVNSAVTVTDITEKYCARTRALATNFYQARNKSQSFKARYAKIKKRENNRVLNLETLRPEPSENKNNFFKITESVPIKVAESLPDKVIKNKSKILIDKTDEDDTNSVDIQELLVPKPTKKVTLVNVEDILKPQKATEKPKSVNPCHVVSAASFIDYERSFMGLLTPSTEWLEKFHKMLNLNLNSVIRQIRLLEWATLVERHRSGVLQLWFNNKKYNNIILTEDRRRPSKSHMNIKLFQNQPMNTLRVPEIITSLFENKLPGVATKDTETYVILVYNGIAWEARGTIVLNDTSEMCRQRLGHKLTPPSILDPILRESIKENTQTKSVSPSNSNIIIRSTSSVSVEVVNRDVSSSSTSNSDNEQLGLEITKIPAVAINENQNIVKPNSSLDKQKDGAILAPLPTGFGLNRWFMLILKNDFSVLRISFSNFHIKYTHLMTAIQTAKNNQKTVRVRSQDKNVENPNNFGVYALPGFSDRIFFGPYDNDAGHGLETFRYVNGRLVNTKIYNKMRGNIEKNTTGIWYFHSSTVQNNLILEPQTDNASSGSDCSTEMTNAEKAVKPQIEFVDLTENDSDSETQSQESPAIQNIDTLFNVLSADFTKKVSGDITIEPVFENVSKAPVIIGNKTNDISIQAINNDSARLTSIAGPHVNTSVPAVKENGYKIDRKRKSLSDIHLEPPKKPTLTVIDSISLDDDDDDISPTVQNQRNINANSVKQMPALCPINNMQNVNNESLIKKSVIYVITNIPGIGYFEIFRTEKKCMQLNINGKATIFPTISMAITWLHQLFRRFVFFMPSNLKVKFSILESTEVPEMSKFNESFLNGYHMMCEKGIFDLIRMSTDDMGNLGFNEKDSSDLLAHKCELLINRNIQILGNYLVGPEESSKLDNLRILQIAPMKIKHMESREVTLKQQKAILKNQQADLMLKINNLLKNVPENFKKRTKETVYSILKVNSKTNNMGQSIAKTNIASPPKDTTNTLPAGTLCKIVDGKVVIKDALSPIKTALQSPVNFKVQPNYPVTIRSSSVQSVSEKSKKSFEMLVPITGLQTPVTVVGVPPKSHLPATSLLLSSHKKSSQTQKIVDLTDD